MQELHDWLTRQLEEKRTEPNSALGGAIAYMLKHWDPADVVPASGRCPAGQQPVRAGVEEGDPAPQERAVLQDPERRRVGDLFMSLIYTCQLNQANPFDYLTQLQRHADALANGPQLWMPWNYRDAPA